MPNLMKAVFLVKNGSAATAFEIRQVAIPVPKQDEVLVKVEAFGLNYAEVMARLGLYRDAPDLPFIPGYDCVGRVEVVGSSVSNNLVGKRIAAMARFGTYAEFCVVSKNALVEIGEEMEPGAATAIGVQFNTAYYFACEAINLFPGDKVLIHAAAGGVGTALVQLCLWKGCEVIGIASTEEKTEALKKAGVSLVINRMKEDYLDVIEEKYGKSSLDVSFNAVAGTTFKKDMKLLGPSGKLVLFGASQRAGKKKGKVADIKLLLSMGILFPIFLVGSSKSIVGVNMLRIADAKPEILKRCMIEVVRLIDQGILCPKIGGNYPVDKIAEAHDNLEKSKTTGKISIHW